MRRLPPLLLLVPLIVSACRDQGPPTAPDTPVVRPQAAIQDAVHAPDDVEGFYFLPPLVPDPGFTGTFNPDLEPIVRVCELDGGDPAACAAEVREFTTDGNGPERVRVDEDEEHYGVNWRTGRDDLDPAKTYRIRVFVAEDLENAAPAVAFLDVRPDGAGSGNPGRGGPPGPDSPSADDDVALFRNGSTLPIRFRIEEGVFCESGDCAEATVDDGGGLVVTNTAFAGVEVPPDALPDGVDEVTITIERLEVADPAECLPLPTTREQFEGCYAIDSEPAVVFEEPLVIGICRDLAADPDDVLIHKFDPDQPQDGVITLPFGGQTTFLECGDFAPTQTVAATDGPLTTFARATLRKLLRPVAAVLGPRPLRAGDVGFTGLSTSLSHFGWAEPEDAVVIEVVTGIGQEGPTGTTLPVEPTVSVTDLHVGPDPTPNVNVTFEFTDAAGAVSTTSLTTDSNGEASAPWPLSAAGGTHVLAVFTPDGRSKTVELTALARGLVTRWSAEGDFTDAVGDNDLATQGGIGFTGGVVGGQAFDFTRGTSTTTTGGWAYAHPTPDIDATDRLTMATWVKLAPGGPAGQFQRFVSVFGGKAVLRQDPKPLSASDRTLRFFMFTGSGFEGLTVDDVLQTGCWHHVAATYDGSEQVLYLDGQAVASQTPASVIALQGDGVFLSNSDNGGGWPPFTGPNANQEKLAGALDEVEIYNEALDASEIQAKWSAGGSGLCQPSGASVSGVVAYSGTPLQGVLVELIPGTNPLDPPTAITNTDGGGSYQFQSVASGTYQLKVNGPTSDFIDWVARTVTVGSTNLTEDVDLPKVITLQSPSDDAFVPTDHPLLEWEAIPEAATYTVQINVTSPWTLVEQTTGITTNSYTVGTALTAGETYTWQVDGYDSQGRWVGTTELAFEFTVVAGAGLGTATIDGVNSPGEWDLAHTFDVFTNDVGLAASTLYVMNDGTNLYLGLHVTDGLSSDDSFEARFDDDNDDVDTDGDDNLFLDGSGGFSDAHFATGFGWGIGDVSDHGAGAVGSISASEAFYEISHPLDSGDSDDLALSGGDVFGLCIRFFEDGTSSTSTTFQENCVLVANQQTLYEDIQVAVP